MKLQEIKNYEKFFVLIGRTGHEVIVTSSYEVFLMKCLLIQQLISLRIQHIFVTNSDAPIQLWRWENLLKHQRVPKHYDQACRF